MRASNGMAGLEVVEGKTPNWLKGVGNACPGSWPHIIFCDIVVQTNSKPVSMPLGYTGSSLLGEVSII
jgi:hypothetical protein